MSISEISTNFLMLAGNGKVKEAFDRFVTDDFIHHNQYFKGDRDALMKAMEADHNSNPNRSIEIKFCYVDKNHVITHALVCKADKEIAVVHIFRFTNDQIAEMWDLGQIIDRDSPNENGLF